MDARYGITWPFMDMTVDSFTQYEPHIVLSTTYTPGSWEICQWIQSATKGQEENTLRFIDVLSTLFCNHGCKKSLPGSPVHDFPGKNTGVVYHFFFQRVFSTQIWTHVSCLAGRFFTTEPSGKHFHVMVSSNKYITEKCIYMIISLKNAIIWINWTKKKDWFNL